MKFFNHVVEREKKQLNMKINRQLQFNFSHRRPGCAFSIITCNKAHSSYHVKLQKEVKSTQKQPSCKKKVRSMQKKDSMKKL